MVLKSTCTFHVQEERQQAQARPRKPVITELNAANHRPLVREIMKLLRRTWPQLGGFRDDDLRELAFAELDAIVQVGDFGEFVTPLGKLTEPGRQRIVQSERAKCALTAPPSSRPATIPPAPSLPFTFERLCEEVDQVLATRAPEMMASLEETAGEQLIALIAGHVFDRISRALSERTPIRRFYDPVNGCFTQGFETMTLRLLNERIRSETP
jgi:hypothetical protein